MSVRKRIEPVAPAVSPLKPAGLRWRRWLLAVFAPVVMIAAAEGVARWWGGGLPSARFFVEQEIAGRRWVLDNPYFGYTFFHPRQARQPAQNKFLVEKPVGSVRVLVLGESAAMGFPNPEFGLARTLKAMLQEMYPGVVIDVIDGTMTMINSHILRGIAEEAMAYEPDVVVIYAGNNEVIGPYGPVGVFGRFYSSGWMVRADRWLRTHSAVVRRLSGAWPRRSDPGGDTWRGLDHFARHPLADVDPGVDRARRFFRENLAAMLDGAVARGIPVVIAAPAVNLTDWPPLHSFEPVGRADWPVRVEAAKEAMVAGRWQLAVEAWREALRGAPGDAGIHYGLAVCLERLGLRDEAWSSFETACDLDGYRFRADSRIAAIVKEEAAARRVRRVTEVEVRRELARHDPAEPMFLEHVHFTLAGMYELASRLAPAVAASTPGLASLTPQAFDRGRVWSAMFVQPDVQELAWAGTGLFLQMSVFRGQEGYAKRVQDVAERRERAAEQVQRITTNQLAEVYSGLALDDGSGWAVRGIYADCLLRRGAAGAAVPVLREAIEAKPNRAEYYQMLGHAYYLERDLEQATRALEKALQLNPYHADAWNSLGLVWYLRGSRENAVDCYREALSVNPAHALALNNLGYLAFEQGRYDDAIRDLRSALASEPTLLEARYHLGLALLATGDLDGAGQSFAEIVRRSPALAKAWSAWGVVLMKRGEVDVARGKFERAIKEQPDLVEARINLGYVWMQKGMPDKALPLFTSAMEAQPDNPEIQHMVGMALGKLDRLDEAKPHLQQAIQAAPHRGDWMLETARLLLSHHADNKALVDDALLLAERAYFLSKNTNQHAADLIAEIRKIQVNETPATDLPIPLP